MSVPATPPTRPALVKLINRMLDPYARTAVNNLMSYIESNQSTSGTTAPDGVNWFTGHGPPPAMPYANSGDLYLDRDTGDVYTLN